MAEISIIIPAYNCEKHIERSMRSALDQTFKDIEVIVVDDASTDSTFQVASKVAKTDDRVRIIRLERNSKCATARKRGVACSTGRYVLFLDADDEFTLEACAKLYETVMAKPAEIIHFGTKAICPSTKSATRTEKYLQPYQGTIYGEGKVFEGCFVKGLFNWNLANKMFDGRLCRKAFEKLPEKDIQRGEDMFAFSMLAYHASSYRGLTEAQYYRYHFGTGQDGDKVINLEEFSSLCDSYIAADEIERMLHEWDAPKNWFAGFDKNKSRLIDNCVYKFRYALCDESKSEAFQVLCDKWGYETAIPAFARQYWSDQGELAKNLKGNNFLAGPKKAVKHIATYYYAYQGGGAEGVLRELLKLWMDQGYKVTLFLDKEPTGEVSVPMGVDIVILPQSQKVNPKNYHKRLKVLVDEVRKRDIDTMVYQTWLNRLMLWDMLTLKSLGVNFIIHCHGLFTNKMRICDKGFAQMPYVYSLADAVVSLSETDKRFWRKFNSNVFLTENPLSFDPESVKPTFCEEKHVLWLGRISPEKHPEDALQIFEVIHNVDPEVKFFMVGGATTKYYEEKIKDMASDLGLDDVLEMPGMVYGDQKLEAFRNARVFLMTSEATEGYPLTLGESKVAGVPCVMYELPYLTMLENPRGIVTVPQRSIAFAAHAILRLLQDDVYCSEMAKAARDSIEGVRSFDFEGLWKAIFAAVEFPRAEPADPDRLLWDSLMEAYSVGVDSITANREWWKGQTKLKEKRIQEFKKSNSWRIGRSITVVPRKMKRVVKRIKGIRED